MVNIAEKLKGMQRSDNAQSLVRESVERLSDRLDRIDKLNSDDSVVIDSQKNHLPENESMKSIQVYVPMSIWKRMTLLKANTGMKMKDMQTEAFDMYLKSKGV